MALLTLFAGGKQKQFLLGSFLTFLERTEDAEPSAHHARSEGEAAQGGWSRGARRHGPRYGGARTGGGRTRERRKNRRRTDRQTEERADDYEIMVMIS